MFFDRRNCRRVRDLVEISGFLEVAIEQLEKLERDTLLEIEKERTRRTNPTDIIVIKEEPDTDEDSNIDSSVSYNKQVHEHSLITAIPSSSLGRQDYKNSSFAQRTSNCSYENNHYQNSNFGTCSSAHEKIDNERECLSNLLEPEVSSKPDIAQRKDTNGDRIMNEDIFNSKTVSVALNCMNQSSSKLNIKKEISNQGCTSSSSIHLVASDKAKTSPDPSRNMIIGATMDLVAQNYKAVIRFKTSLSCSAVKHILKANDLCGLHEVFVSNNKAIVTFTTHDHLQKCLKMRDKAGLRKLSAWSIRPYKNSSEPLLKNLERNNCT